MLPGGVFIFGSRSSVTSARCTGSATSATCRRSLGNMSAALSASWCSKESRANILERMIVYGGGGVRIRAR